ncbi:MAG: hypothetical protein DRP64_03685 [Verrucomicrobia bacterium]|nr:MAG: hypothetical protein DRP64_03685 [Verrucomicrobiota bacterium]RLA58987.1 MAG: hypothetical protein DRQ89_14705 [Campylobacterota bacterium]
MLIVHDGGGCQVGYADLAPDSLSAQQRNTIEEKLTEYVDRKARREQLQLEQKAFEQAQRGKGLVLFEGNWMSGCSSTGGLNVSFTSSPNAVYLGSRSSSRCQSSTHGHKTVRTNR